jgi:holin-like protein
VIIMRLKARLRWLCRHHPQLSRLLQILALTGLWGIGQTVVAVTALPVPGSVVALAMLLGLLRTGAVPAWLLKRGADWLLAEMLLFFIPAVMVLPRYVPLLEHDGARLLGIMAVGSMLVMVGSALAVDLVWRLAGRRHTVALTDAR